MKSKIFYLLFAIAFGAAINLRAGEIQTGKPQTKLVYTSGGTAQVSFQASVSSVQFREVMTREGAFTELFIPDHFNAPVAGDPNLPACCRLIEVPFNQGFDIEITHAGYQDYDLASVGITNRIMPVQPSLSKSVTDLATVPFVINNAVYLANRFAGQPLVAVTPAGILRSVNLAHLVISPVQYNPVTNQLRIYSFIEATVRFIQPDAKASARLKSKNNSIYFNNLSGLVDNSLNLPDSLITSSPVTFVIVSPQQFRSTLQPLVKWKTRKGFRVIQAYTDNPAVGTTTTSIKNYLKGLFTTPAPGYNPPSFILFVGDVAQIPTWMNNGQATDLRYCEYTGDNLPEVFYGRFSATSVTQLQSYIDKTLEYEQYLFPDDSFLNEVVMVAGYDGGGNGLTYGNGQINYGTTYYFNTAHHLTSHTYLQPQPSGVNYSQLIRGNVSAGVGFANYTAHGSETGWADPQFSTSNIAALQNAHKYCLMVGNCCLTSKYNVNCFAEEITRAANKGAIGYIGASNNSLWDEDFWWGCGMKTVTTSPVYSAIHLGAYDVTFHDHGEPLGSWFTTMAQMVVGGNLAVQQSNSSNKLYYWEIYNLMGDPSLNIYYSVPDPMAATLPQVMLLGATTCTALVEPWSYVALSINDSTLLDAKCADSSGSVTLQFNELTVPGYARFVITKQNRKPIIDSVVIIQPTGPYITLGNVTVNDSTGGNNNKNADYDETVSLNLVINNVGVAAASNLMVSIATSDTNVTVLSGIYLYGAVPSDTSVTGAGAFSIKIKNNVPDQYPVSFNLIFTDGSSSWTGSYTMTLNAPLLEIGSITVLDPVPGGNNNGVFDPGETAQLSIRINNTGHSPATNASGFLSVMAGSTGFFLLNNQTSFVGNIPVSGYNSAWFSAVSNGITPPGANVGLSLSVVAGQSNQFKAFQTLNLVIGQQTPYPMSNTILSACDGVFYDAGGPTGNYPNYQDLTMTINAANTGARLRAIFTEFNLESQSNCNYDYLKIFNGPSNLYPLIGIFCGTQIPDTITSSTTGALTFLFHSDYHNNYQGWAATLKCVGGPLSLLANSFPASVCQGSSSQLVAIVNGGSGNYTYQWSPSTYLDDPSSATPIATPLSDITYTVVISDGVDNLTSGPVSLSILPLPQSPVISFNGSEMVSDIPTGNQWYINGNLIPNATGQTYTPAASGDYTATFTQTGGCESAPSNLLTWLVTGMTGTTKDDLCQIYPNPAREQLTIMAPVSGASMVAISVCDAAGRELIKQDHRADPMTAYSAFNVDVSQLSTGIYYCTIQTDKIKTVKKVIITK
jgi:hypothetical protein